MITRIPEQIKPVFLYQGAADAVACDVVCCKNAHRVTFVVVHNGASDTDLTMSLYEATDVAAGTNAAITATCPLWADTDMGSTSDTLVRQTDDYDFTIDTTTLKNQLWVIEWDPAKHTAGYDCVYLADSGGHASNIVSIVAYIEQRYQGDTPPTNITD